MTIPKQFAEIIGIKVGTKVELELAKKDSIILKVVNSTFQGNLGSPLLPK